MHRTAATQAPCPLLSSGKQDRPQPQGAADTQWGSMVVRWRPWTRSPRCTAKILTGLIAGATVLAVTACSDSGGAAGASGTAHGGSSQASYQGPSWASYLDTHPGRTCTLKGTLSMGGAGAVLSTLAQTVVSSSGSESATVIHYRIQTASVASAGGVPPIRSSMTVPYEILSNGMLGVAPGGYAMGSGLQITFDGFEMYPTVAELRSGRAITSSVSGTLTGTTAAARVRTPAGTFHDLVAVDVKMTSMTPLNATAQAKSALEAGGSLAGAFGSRLYFAKGTGLVQAYSGGVTEQLAGCSG